MGACVLLMLRGIKRCRFPFQRVQNTPGAQGDGDQAKACYRRVAQPI